MAFKTRIDYSKNRQIRQNIETFTNLSGGTVFGVPFSTLPVGPDPITSGISQSYVGVVSTFSGNSGTTVYTWFDPRMALAAYTFSALTPSNSATTQNSGLVFTAETTTVIDGNTVALTYSGVSFDITVIAMSNLGGGNYSGSVTTVNLDILSANTLDFTGRTIWVDVSGITRTNKLIITDNAVPSYVWTCIDSEGNGGWLFNGTGSTGGITADTYWISGSSGTNSVKTKFNSGDATGNYALAEGSATTASGVASHAEGFRTTASGLYAHSEGRDVVASGIYSHAEGWATTAQAQSSHAEGAFTTAIGNNSHTEGNECVAIGGDSHAEGDFCTSIGPDSHAEGTQSTSSGQTSHAEGRNTTSIGDRSHAGGDNSVSYGDTSFIHSVNSLVSGNRSAVFGGQNITGATDDTVYVPNLIVYTGTSFGSMIGLNTLNPQNTLDLYGIGSSVVFNSSVSTSKQFNLSGDPSSLTTLGAVTNATGVNLGMRGPTSPGSLSGYGLPNDAFVYAGNGTHGLNIIKANSGGSFPDYIRMYAGVIGNADVSSTPNVHIDGPTGFVGIGLTGITQQLDVALNARFRTIGAGASAGVLNYTANGTLTTATSDVRLKTNVTTISNALDKVKALRGVYYNWTENPSGNTRVGFIAQEVNSVIPELSFINENSEEKYMGVHYDNVTALLVEAVKELSSGITGTSNVYLETQTILAEDNDIQLNFSGNQQTSIGGGITVLHAKGDDTSVSLVTDRNGDWVTDNDFKAKALTIPNYTPSGSTDTSGNLFNITADDNYVYIKTNNGWKRTTLESF